MRPMRLLMLFAVIETSVSVGFGGAITTPAYTFSSISLSSDAPLTLGFRFKTNRPVLITELGYFDEGSDGFGVLHEVGLFNSDGALLASTTLSVGTADPLDGHFRYRPIAPIELPPDAWYVLAATTGGPTDPWGYGHANSIDGLSISPLISVPSDASLFVYQVGNTLEFPTIRFGYQLYSGPNMMMTDAAAVPEPGSIILVLAGAIGIGLFGFRRQSPPA